MGEQHTPGHDQTRDAIFCAAISGICANPYFFGSLFQQSPQAAVDFASEVVARACGDHLIATGTKDPASEGGRNE